MEDTIEAKLDSYNKKIKFKFGGTEKSGIVPLFLDKKNHHEIKNRTVKSKTEPLDEVVQNVCKNQTHSKRLSRLSTSFAIKL